MNLVSGSVDPDTFELIRNADGTFDLDKQIVGSKQFRLDVQLPQRIHTRSSAHERIVRTAITSPKLCMSTEQVMRLCAAGVQAEKVFGSIRDIEWAFVNSRLYLLQARPITSVEIETETLHEFDSQLTSADQL